MAQQIPERITSVTLDEDGVTEIHIEKRIVTEAAMAWLFNDDGKELKAYGLGLYDSDGETIGRFILTEEAVIQMTTAGVELTIDEIKRRSAEEE